MKPKLINFYNLNKDLLAGQILQYGAIHISITSTYWENDKQLHRLFRRLESIGVADCKATNTSQETSRGTETVTRFNYTANQPIYIYVKDKKRNRAAKIKLDLLSSGSPYEIVYRQIQKKCDLTNPNTGSIL